jgi:DNA-binding response OmpR family regulator
LLEQVLEELEDEGVEILSASNGRDALKLIENEIPDLVFLDVMMPYMNGFEVCQSIKSNQNLKDRVYIIMLTAKGQEFDKKKGAEVGANIYMTKPFDPDEVLDKAAEILGIEF